MSINKDIFNLHPGDLVEIKGITFNGKPSVVTFLRYTTIDERSEGFFLARQSGYSRGQYYHLWEIDPDNKTVQVLYGS